MTKDAYDHWLWKIKVDALNVTSLGSFTLAPGVVYVGDPCYKPETWCLPDSKLIWPGTWSAWIINMGKGSGMDSGRVGALLALHDPLPFNILGEEVWEYFAEFGVDSGQAGLVDAAHKGVDEGFDAWYTAVCDATHYPRQAGVVPGGVFSSTGWGDGVYDCFAIMDEVENVSGLLFDYALIDQKEEEGDQQ